MPPQRPLICVPTYNEARNIERLFPAIWFEVPDAHVLVVDDGSPDGTGQIVDAWAEREERVSVIHRTEKRGLGPAYVAAFRWALEHNEYDAIVQMDADFSHKPEYLPELIGQLERYDLVIGSRYIAGGGTSDWGLARRLISRGGGAYARAVLGIDIHDLTAGFVAWRPDALRALELERIAASGYVFQIEMKYRSLRAGLRALEVPIVFPDRTDGDSKMTPSIALEALWRVPALRFKS